MPVEFDLKRPPIKLPPMPLTGIQETIKVRLWSDESGKVVSINKTDYNKSLHQKVNVDAAGTVTAVPEPAEKDYQDLAKAETQERPFATRRPSLD